MLLGITMVNILKYLPCSYLECIDWDIYTQTSKYIKIYVLHLWILTIFWFFIEASYSNYVGWTRSDIPFGIRPQIKKVINISTQWNFIHLATYNLRWIHVHLIKLVSTHSSPLWNRHIGEHAQMVIIKNAGHALNIEKSKEFARHLKSFLIDSESRSSSPPSFKEQIQKTLPFDFSKS